MAEEKKYSAQEAALAVLKKANQLLKESPLTKAENVPTPAPTPKGPENNIEKQPAPQNNPAEQKENGNPQPGAIPGNGVMKLMYFMGHIHSKKKHKKVGV